MLRLGSSPCFSMQILKGEVNQFFVEIRTGYLAGSSEIGYRAV